MGRLLGYGPDMVGTMVKVTGTVAPGTLKPAGEGQRFVVTDGTEEMGVMFDGALSEEVADGATVVITGSLNNDGDFDATEVALQA